MTQGEKASTADGAAPRPYGKASVTLAEFASIRLSGFPENGNLLWPLRVQGHWDHVGWGDRVGRGP